MTPALRKRVRVGVLLWAIYGLLFVLDEHLIQMNDPRLHMIHSALDDRIPFNAWFVFPYLYWIPLIVIVWLLFLFKATDAEYRYLCRLVMIGAYIILLFYLIYPTALDLRPATLPDDLPGRIMRWLESTDTPTNVFPSLHVYISLCLANAVASSPSFRKNTALKLWIDLSAVIIILSTVMIKQHSVLDLLAGGISALLAFAFVAAFPYLRFKHKAEKEGIKDEVDFPHLR